MFLSFAELADIILMAGILGFLFKDNLRAPPKDPDAIIRARHRKVTWDDFWWACALVAPGILLHELGHKFTAMAFGHAATFHAACSVSVLGSGHVGSICMLQLVMILLKFIGFPFLFFIPGYVSFASSVAPLQGALIAFAGPAIHLLFWGGCTLYLRDKKRTRKLSHRAFLFLAFTAKLNLLLFIFNMLPIPGFDGFQVLRYLYLAVF